MFRVKMVSAVIFVLFIASNLASAQVVDIMPKKVVKNVGEDLIVTCKVAYKIDSCRFTIGGQSYRLLPEVSEGDVVYTGQGLELGDCGAHIKNLKAEWNGPISCVVPPPNGNLELTGVMTLIVAKAPAEPQLITPYQATFRENDIITAQCVVPNGRPAATITWFLDDVVLTDGVHKPDITSFAGLESIRQNVTRKLTADDNLKTLVCQVDHPAFTEKRNKTRQLSVEYPPRIEDSDNKITIFGLKVGEEGRLNVTVRSNPAPTIEWTVGEVRLRPKQTNDQLGVTALEPQSLGKGFFNVTLLINDLEKDHVGRSYILHLGNDLGTEEIEVLLSTMSEPAGLELGSGAIAGIVVILVFILMVIFLIVFAKATSRWCFKAGRRRDAKASGESSDTESAVGGKTERSRLAELGARMRAVLPRSKDKVQATETTAAADDDDKQSEEKKGVVYAELALGAQPTHDKPQPPTSEYAEIVYTDKPADAQPENK